MDELRKAQGVIALARFRSARDRLRKSAAQPAALTVDPKAAPKAQGPQPGAFVRVQRPNVHPQPTLARLLSSGKDGVLVMDAQGRAVKVRHTHVVDRVARPTARERATFASETAAMGIPQSLEDRFLSLDPQGQPARRPTAAQLGLLQELTAHGIPVDLARIGTDATYDDAEDLLARYVTDPEEKIGHSKFRAAGTSEKEQRIGLTG